MKWRRWIAAGFAAGALVWLVLPLVRPAGVTASNVDGSVWTAASREDALRRAVVWSPPATPIEQAQLDATTAPVTCAFHLQSAPTGTSPKFDCQLPDGEIVKVKYSGPEPHAEVAASRLLTALGFGADSVTLAERVHCRGCPSEPYTLMKLLDGLQARGLHRWIADYDRAVDFEWAAIERLHDAERIETPTLRGWSWGEFAAVPTASREHADALRLLAVFLAHWDNKAENQRLVCLDARPNRGGRCERPFAMLQDVGATFGPRKVDVKAWRQAPIWADRRSCLVSMEGLPYSGSTFVPVRVSESGRRFLGDRLGRLSGDQIEGLFRGARFDRHDATLREWTEAFSERVRQIVDGSPCPEQPLNARAGPQRQP